MSSDTPKSLQELRNRLSPLQLKAIKHCWAHYRETGKWIQTRALHVRLGNPEAEVELAKMSGSLIYSNHSENAQRYQLGGLGIFVSDESGELFDLAVELLKRQVKSFTAQPERDLVPIAELVANADSEKKWFPEHDDKLALSLIQNTGGILGNASGTIADYKWDVSFPPRIEWIRFEPDLAAYLEGQLLARFNPEEPMNESGQLLNYLRSQDENFSELLIGGGRAERQRQDLSLFAFVTHNELRELVEADWREAQLAYSAAVWKGCVILCAGIIEGVLGYALMIRAAGASPESDEGSREWNLDALIKQAYKAGLIRSSSSNLYQAVRQVRNLVHLRRQLDEGIKIQESDAQYAKAAVADIARELARSNASG